jgi:hypothetical protein
MENKMEIKEKDDLNKENPEVESKFCLIKRENKTYLNCIFCEFNIGLFFTYLYIFSAAMLNVVNRILFQNFQFNFNFTLILLQQVTSLILFYAASNNKNFKNKVGEISWVDFKKHIYYYLSFTVIFITNTFFNFYGNQLVKNVSMFFPLKKQH